MNSLQRALQELDLGTLETLAGQTIVRAVQCAYDVNRERALARLVIDRYGTSILKQVEIRKCLIDGLPSAQAALACDELNLSPTPGVSAFRRLQDYFSGSFTQERARQFVSVFALPEDLVPPIAEDERSAVEFIQAGFGEVVTLRGYLHPYQRRVKDRLGKYLADGTRRMMAQMPTGSGKTVTALEVVVDVLRRPSFSGIVVWAVDSNELAEQALESFIALWKTRGDRPTRAYRYFGEFQSDFRTADPGVVFLSFAKAYAAIRASDEATRSNFNALPERASLVIVDEAHTSIADTYEEVIRALIRNDAPLLGLSATPGRNNADQTVELARLYGQTLVSISDDDGREIGDEIGYLRRKGYLADVVFEDLQSGATVSLQEEGRICAELAENAERNEQITKQIERAIHLEDSTLVFSCTKDHVFALMALCRAKKIEAGFIVGETPQHERIALLRRFRIGDLRILINHQILSAGVDLPNVDRLIITRPVGSPILYSQILGRALRGPSNGGNATNTVVNIQDNLVNFPSASFVYREFKATFASV